MHTANGRGSNSSCCLNGHHPPSIGISLAHHRDSVLTTCALQKMNALRLEADEAQAQVEELKNKVKSLEQENLAKEQEITSLTHRNQILESQVEKLETDLKEAKDAASHSAQHDAQNEALQRRLQLLEEEAEEADKTLRETNEKYVFHLPVSQISSLTAQAPSNRRQGRPLRAQGAGSGGVPRPVGGQVRGDVEEVRGFAEGAARSGGFYKQRLKDGLYMGIARRVMPDSAFLHRFFAHLGHIFFCSADSLIHLSSRLSGLSLPWPLSAPPYYILFSSFPRVSPYNHISCGT